MIRFAEMIAGGAPAARALEALPPDEAEAARRLLSGQRPKRIASGEVLLGWAAEAAGIPDFLVEASLAVSGDRLEVAALLLGPADGKAPGLAEVVDVLEGLAGASEAEKREAWLGLAQRLAVEARLVLNRLASGSFRLGMKPELAAVLGPREFRAVLTMIAPQGPEGTFALLQGNGFVPIVKLRLEGDWVAEVLGWAREHVVDRFGPNLQLETSLVFSLACEGAAPNGRKKCGLDLLGARVVRWEKGASVDQVTMLEWFVGAGQDFLKK